MGTWWQSHFALTWSTKRSPNRPAMTWSYSPQPFLVIELLSEHISLHLPSLDTEPNELNDKAQKEPVFFFCHAQVKYDLPDLSGTDQKESHKRHTVFARQAKLLGFVYVLTFTLVGKYFLWCINILLNQIMSRSTTLAFFFLSTFYFEYISLNCSGWPWTHLVAQTALQISVFLSQSPE